MGSPPRVQSPVWGDDSQGQSTPPAELSSNTLSSTAPDLVVRSASVSDSNVEAGDTFTFSATVYNQGDGAASATTLRYYQSTDATVDANDTAVSTDRVVSLDPAEDDDESERLTAPTGAGTHYYGACVDPVPGESEHPQQLLVQRGSYGECRQIMRSRSGGRYTHIELTLSDGEWWCGGCSARDERDYNAAVNLENWPV